MTATTQRMTALESANRIRVQRAEWFRELRAMQTAQAARQIADVLEVKGRGLGCDALNFVMRTDVADLLAVPHRIGKVHVRALARIAGVPRLAVSHNFTVRHLTKCEALALADALRQSYPVAA